MYTTSIQVTEFYVIIIYKIMTFIKAHFFLTGNFMAHSTIWGHPVKLKEKAKQKF